MAYSGKVKCIYIDPPYNMGNRDFVYNDRFVDKDHAWRHSMWVEFMFQRLTLARDLLAQDGAIFVSIDDNEIFHFGMLMNEVFGDQAFVANCIWQKRYSRENRENIGDAHEYLLVYSPKPEEFKKKRGLIPLGAQQAKNYSNPDSDERGDWTSISFTAQGFRKNQMYEITAPNGRKHNPPDGRCCAKVEDEFKKLIVDEKMWWGKTGDGVPRVKQFLSDID